MTENSIPMPDGLAVVPRDPADRRVATRRDGALKHANGCRMTFGRLDPDNCARCIERGNERAVGIAGRADHAGSARRQRAEWAAQDDRDRVRHFAPGGPHARGECGPVCTAFDW